MKLINGDSLLKEAKDRKPLNWTDSPEEIQEQNDWEMFLNMINEASTIDAVPVVRCGECRHFGKTKENDTYCVSPDGLGDPTQYDFCSYGKRKDSTK